VHWPALFPGCRIRDLVRAHRRRDINHTGHRFDTGGIDLAQLLDPADDVVQLARQRFQTFVGHADTRQKRDLADIVLG